ncbi:MAG TPA: cytochrome c [Thermoanaerobaculia bacterium]|nr:cytochrome c [Thermoanaerobaculia bacterium]
MRRTPRIGWLLALLAALLVCAPAGSSAASKKRRKPAKTKAAPVNFDVKLPVLGTRLSGFPPGEGKTIADQACLACHSTDMVRQQRLTEKQWAASVTKMAGWGAEVPESKRDALIAYLVKNFGPDNDRFEPVVTRPVGR